MEQQKTDTPAILGGEPAVTLPQTEANRWPILTEEDEKAVVEVMRLGNILKYIDTFSRSNLLRCD